MSLVDGLLNRTCKVLRPQFQDDGSGGEVISSYVTIATNFEILISQGSTNTTEQDGGRTNISELTAYSDWVDETKLNINDVLTDVTDPETGNVETDVVNGVSTPASFKVKGRNDPNFEHDHLECPVEKVHGRAEGQP